MLTVSVVGPKGGCGKTTTAISLAGLFAGKGMRTLLIDVDPQGHCAAGLAIPAKSVEFNAGDAMNSLARSASCPSEYAWHISRGLSLIPGGRSLERFGVTRRGAEDPEAEWTLDSLIRRMWDAFDVCVVDAPASEGILRRSAINAASMVVVPVEVSYYSLLGVDTLMERISQQSERRATRQRVAILPTMYDGSTIATDLLEQLRSKWGARVSPYPVRSDVSVREAASFGQPVGTYNKDAPASKDYASVCDWLCGQADDDRSDLLFSAESYSLARFIRDGDRYEPAGRTAEPSAKARPGDDATPQVGSRDDQAAPSRLDHVAKRVGEARAEAQRARTR